MNSIEVVVTNWKRPGNYEQIVQALREQTIPCTITICDCHHSEEFALPEKVVNNVDRLYRWGHNLGGYNRYAPLGTYDHTYTFFMDDDLLPGKRCLESFLDVALQMEDEFGVLGQFGRIVPPDNSYSSRDVPRKNHVKEVDFIVQAYFVKTSRLYTILKFRWKIGYFDDRLPHDDLLLCSSFKYYHDLRSFLLPANEDKESSLDKSVLNNDFGHWKLPEHFPLRQQFIQRLLFYGWEPLYKTGPKYPTEKLELC